MAFSISQIGNLGAHLSSGSLARFIPEPKSATGLNFKNILGGIGSFVGRIAGAGMNPEYQDLLNAQIETQNQLQLLSMQSNIEKSKHETRMAAVRNIRVG